MSSSRSRPLRFSQGAQQAGLLRALDVASQAVAHHDRPARGRAGRLQGSGERAGIRLADPHLAFSRG